jgi:hypothetical protein
MDGNAAVSGNLIKVLTFGDYWGGGILAENGASFTMRGNASVSENTFVAGIDEWGDVQGENVYGGGVAVKGASTITMEGNAFVSGNSIGGSRDWPHENMYGGGVSVTDNSDFTMTGNASVFGNFIPYSNNNRYGGGLYIGNGSTCVMSVAASVYGNTMGCGQGGGVAVGNGRLGSSPPTLIMRGNASVSGNSIDGGEGGGISVNTGRLEMADNSTVSGNRADGSVSYGGGVYVKGREARNQYPAIEAEFIMTGNAMVSGNTAKSPIHHAHGGGVYIVRTRFTMSGGSSVSDNYAEGSYTYFHFKAAAGGGIFVTDNATITMSGSASVSGNTVKCTENGSALGGGIALYRRADANNKIVCYLYGNSSISGNSAVSTGGGDALGGGVYLVGDDDQTQLHWYSGTVYGNSTSLPDTMKNTVSSPQGSAEGAAIYNHQGRVYYWNGADINDELLKNHNDPANYVVDNYVPKFEEQTCEVSQGGLTPPY